MQQEILTLITVRMVYGLNTIYGLNVYYNKSIEEIQCPFYIL